MVAELIADADGGGTAESVFDDLDRVQQVLDHAGLRGPARGAILVRLRELLRVCEGTGNGQGLEQGDAVPDRLAVASDDDVFDFIGNELGIS
jgi:hypothetical protein